MFTLVPHLCNSFICNSHIFGSNYQKCFVFYFFKLFIAIIVNVKQFFCFVFMENFRFLFNKKKFAFILMEKMLK